MRQLTILEYLDRSGSSPFVDWFATLDATAAAKVTIATRRLELGNFSNVKAWAVGSLSIASTSALDIASFRQGWRVDRHLARRRDEETSGP
jgi:putative component of toxin-antitoxin plasmid stabilization module